MITEPAPPPLTLYETPFGSVGRLAQSGVRRSQCFSMRAPAMVLARRAAS